MAAPPRIDNHVHPRLTVKSIAIQLQLISIRLKPKSLSHRPDSELNEQALHVSPVRTSSQKGSLRPRKYFSARTNNTPKAGSDASCSLRATRKATAVRHRIHQSQPVSAVGNKRYAHLSDAAVRFSAAERANDSGRGSSSVTADTPFVAGVVASVPSVPIQHRRTVVARAASASRGRCEQEARASAMVPVLMLARGQRPGRGRRYCLGTLETVLLPHLRPRDSVLR